MVILTCCFVKFAKIKALHNNMDPLQQFQGDELLVKVVYNIWQM